MSDRSLRYFLDTSLQTLSAQCPQAHAAVSHALAGCTVGVTMGSERFVLSGHDDSVRTAVPAPGRRPEVEVATDRRTILDVVGARLTLLQAVETDRLLLRGGPQDLLRFHDALMAFVAGGVRAPSFSALLAAFASDDGDTQDTSVQELSA